jgi:uncharacterized membrane protein
MYRVTHRRLRAGLLATLLPLGLALFLPATVLVSTAAAAEPLSVTTPYPSVAAQPGASVSFPITVTTDATRTVALTVDGVPQGGSARLTGGGFTVDAVQAESGKPASVSLDVTLPANATGIVSLTVHATSGSLVADLPLRLRIEGGAGGSVTIDPPTGQKVAAGGSLTFNLTLHNNTPRDTTFTFSTQQPDGWQVNAQPGGSSQATSLQVAAASTGSVTVNVASPTTATAGDYKVEVDSASDGSVQPDPVILPVTITGSYTLSLTQTSDETLQTSAQPGAGKAYVWVVQNTGSGPLANLTVSATPPTGWTVTFDAATIPSLAPGKSQNVTATITPSGNAVAGDYTIAFNVSAPSSGSIPGATASQTVRVTVQVGLNWLVVGGAIILLVLVGLSWVFGRFGRR